MVQFTGVTFSGGFSIQAPPPPMSFTISPAVSGKTTWDLQADGPLILDTAGTWTMTPISSISANVKIWGAGGGGNYMWVANTNAGGGGGAATAGVTFDTTKTYTLIVGEAGSTGSLYTGSGGGAGTGINNGTAHVLIAGGGGGGFGGYGGGGGGTTGGTGTDDYGEGYPGMGGTQSAGGAGGSGRSGRGGSPGGSPGVLIGGVGGDGGQANGYSSSRAVGYGNGGLGGIRAGDTGGSGGGGGYYGGGGGGVGGGGGGGGGGGSGYFNPSLTTNGTLYAASGVTPGNPNDPNRGTAGNPKVAGKIYIAI